MEDHAEKDNLIVFLLLHNFLKQIIIVTHELKLEDGREILLGHLRPNSSPECTSGGRPGSSEDCKCLPYGSVLFK